MRAGRAVARDGADVIAGELKGMEEQSCMGPVDFAVGEGGEEGGDDELDGFRVLEGKYFEDAACLVGCGHGEGVLIVLDEVVEGLGRPLGDGGLRGFGGAMHDAELAMEVAERLAAKRGRLAAVAVGLDVAAEGIGAGCEFGWHGVARLRGSVANAADCELLPGLKPAPTPV